MPYWGRWLLVVADGRAQADPPEVRSVATSELVITVLGAAVSVALGGGLGSALSTLLSSGAPKRPADMNKMPLHVIERAQASQLKLPVRHPRDKVVYAGHPLDWRIYVPVADIHRVLFESKVAEAMRMLRSLGAISISVEHVEGWNDTSGISAGVKVPGVAPDVALKGGRSRSRKTSVMSKMTLDPSGEPFLPDNLVWAQHEALWLDIADARLNSGLKKFSLDVTSTDDYGIDISIEAEIEKVGLSVGGTLKNHEQATWKLSGTFS
jgi:hypothetical protein